jgi:mannose-6-phosphate isomerase-like protein (cupin superfamily)
MTELSDADNPDLAWAVSPATARGAPVEPGRSSALLLRRTRGNMTLRHYAPRGQDLQKPHDQDELYIVIAGQGSFVRAGERVPFGPGDVLFAAAGEEHRFVDFSDDFETWVVFYGPRD